MTPDEFVARLHLDKVRAEILWEQILIDLDEADAFEAFPSETEPQEPSNLPSF